MVFFKIAQPVLEKLKIDKNQLKFGLIESNQFISLLDQWNKDHEENEKYYIHQLITKDDIFYSENLKKIQQDSYEDPPEIKREKQLRESRIREQQYQSMVKNILPKQHSWLLGTDSPKEYEKSISFGISFIFSFFLSGLAGYYIGKYFFLLSEGQSMVLAVVILILSLIVETLLFIIKILKDEKKKKINESEEKQNKAQMQQDLQNQIYKTKEETSTKSDINVKKEANKGYSQDMKHKTE